MAEGKDASNKITVTVKTPKTKESIIADENAEIKEVSGKKEQKKKLEWGNRIGGIVWVIAHSGKQLLLINAKKNTHNLRVFCLDSSTCKLCSYVRWGIFSFATIYAFMYDWFILMSIVAAFESENCFSDTKITKNTRTRTFISEYIIFNGSEAWKSDDSFSLHHTTEMVTCMCSWSVCERVLCVCGAYACVANFTIYIWQFYFYFVSRESG